ncbi:MAG: PIN domain-containing protein [Acidimicrobiales bacterium]
MAPKKLPDGRLLVDASFVIAVAGRDPSANRFRSVLSRSSIVDVNLGEVFYKLDAVIPWRDVASALATEGVEVLATGPAGAARFVELKATDLVSREKQRRSGVAESKIKSLSLADIACLSTALVRDSPVLTGDTHWQSLGLALSIYDYHDPELTL